MRRRAGPLAVIVVALAAALVLAVLTVAPGAADDDPSSRVAGKAGTLALHDWLDRLGFATHRIAGDFSLAGTDVLVMVEPTAALSDADAAAVTSFVSAGGDVILAVSPAHAAAAAPLLSRLTLTLSGARVAGDSVPAQPIDAGNRVAHVTMGAGPAIEANAALTPLLVQGLSLTAVAERIGSGGRAYVLASTLPLSNAGLRTGDAPGLVLSLLSRARGGHIAFDEYHHGEQNGIPTGATAIFVSPLGLALLLAAAAILLHLALSGRRVGRPLPTAVSTSVPSTTTYVEAMAGLYGRSRRRASVADRYAVELKQRVATLTGVDPALDDALFVLAAAAHRRPLAAETRELLERARSLAGGDPSARALLELARAIDSVERRWSEPAAAETAAQ